MERWERSRRSFSGLRHRRKPIGSGVFIVTLLVVLGLGGGLLLAFLPFNSVERTAIAPRSSHEPRYQPPQNSVPSSVETGRHAAVPHESTFAISIAPVPTRTFSLVDANESEAESVGGNVVERRANENVVRAETEFSPRAFIPTNEYLAMKTPTSARSVGAYEALQTAVVPEPTTRTLLALGTLLVIAMRCLRSRARR